MENSTMTKKIIIGIVLCVVAIGGFVGFFYFFNTTPGAISPIAVDPTWTKASSGNYAFYYPKADSGNYVSVLDWPPTLQVLGNSSQSGDPVCPTASRVINGKKYCVTVTSEGAAGSTYNQYAYVSKFSDGSQASLTFTARLVQCANYDEPLSTECKSAQASFDSDALADGVFRTISVRESSDVSPVPPSPAPGSTAPGEPVACQMDARICPDGVTVVGRTGPRCEFQACPGEVADGTVGPVALNEKVSLGGISITPLEVVSDSRCPADVVCVAAGEVVVRARLESSAGATAASSREIQIRSTPVAFAGKNISLKTVTPAKHSGESILSNQYRFTFSITK